MTKPDRHPRETTNCPECGAWDWVRERRLPQIGPTYACADCGHEMYVYDAGAKNQTNRQFRPVTNTMARRLRIYELVGEWPDTAAGDLMDLGVPRSAAIDYHAVEREGLTQTEWADRLGVSQVVVSKNVRAAKERLSTV